MATGTTPFTRLRQSAVSQLLSDKPLGHTSEGEQSDGEQTPRNLRECEAEAVALICCSALGLPGVECSRGYIQSWWGQGNPIPERSAQRVLKVADLILKAGSQQRIEAGGERDSSSGSAPKAAVKRA
jgi:hypothetical protein